MGKKIDEFMQSAQTSLSISEKMINQLVKLSMSGEDKMRSAAIEAAHVEEKGKGFAAVASEMRKTCRAGKKIVRL